MGPDAVEAGPGEDDIELDQLVSGGRSREAAIDQKGVRMNEIDEVGAGDDHVAHGAEKGLKVLAGAEAVIEKRFFSGDGGLGSDFEGGFEVGAFLWVDRIGGEIGGLESSTRQKKGAGDELGGAMGGIEIGEQAPVSTGGGSPIEFENAGGNGGRVLMGEVLEVFGNEKEMKDALVNEFEFADRLVGLGMENTKPKAAGAAGLGPAG